jgi:hypothetical protein
MILDEDDIEAIASRVVEKLLVKLPKQKLPFDPITFQKAYDAFITGRDKTAITKFTGIYDLPEEP